MKQSKIPKHRPSSWIASSGSFWLLAALPCWSYVMLWATLLCFDFSKKWAVLGCLPAGALTSTQKLHPFTYRCVSSNSTFQSTGPIYSSHLLLAEISRNDYQYLDKNQSFKQCSKQDPRTEKRVPISLASSPQRTGLASWACVVNRIASS